MKRLIVFVFLSVGLCASDKRQINYQFGYRQDACIADHQAVEAFREAIDDFTINLYKHAASQGNYFFILSPPATWVTLAAIGEGADYNTQKELFNLLNLPQDACARQKFYQIAASRTSSNSYVNVFNNRALIIDQSSGINPNWYSLVNRYSLLGVVAAPMKTDVKTTLNIINQYIPLKDRGLNFNGNSVLLNAIDYNGLWTTAFDDAKINRAPFYSQGGHQIGSIDLIRIKQKARIGYVPGLKSKILDLPIGLNGEYRMIFALVGSEYGNVESAIAALNNRTLVHVIASLQDSNIPIDIAIPKFVIDSEIDMKQILEGMGIVNLWRKPETTRYISTPPAYPTSYIHRASLTIDSRGIYPPTFEYSSYSQSTGSQFKEFIANRPFMFGLFDAETYTCLIAGLYTKPTYLY